MPIGLVVSFALVKHSSIIGFLIYSSSLILILFYPKGLWYTPFQNTSPFFDFTLNNVLFLFMDDKVSGNDCVPIWVFSSSTSDFLNTSPKFLFGCLTSSNFLILGERLPPNFISWVQSKIPFLILRARWCLCCSADLRELTKSYSVTLESELIYLLWNGELFGGISEFSPNLYRPLNLSLVLSIVKGLNFSFQQVEVKCSNSLSVMSIEILSR